MPLDLTKLDKTRAKGEATVARCPACAEAGRDRVGNHLWIGADGRFGCVANAGDREHNQRIWALAGDKEAELPKARRRKLVIRPVAVRTFRTPKDHSLEVYYHPTQPTSERKPSVTSENDRKESLVPRDAPWVEGQRYRLAEQTDANRLDLFLTDPAGPWVRRYGTLLAVACGQIEVESR